MRLEGKTAIVTGASRGIGRAIAQTFAAEGADVVVNYAHAEKAAQATTDVIEQFGRRALLVKADIARKEEMKFLVNKTVNEFGKIDILVNNAGIYIRTDVKELTEKALDERVWQTTMDTNLKSVYYLSVLAAPHLAKQKGAIINMGSYVGLKPRMGNVEYYITKSGVHVLTQYLAQKLASRVRVNCIAPGSIETDLSGHGEEWKKGAAEASLVGRPGRPEDIAPLAVYLASDESSFMTGSIVVIDGGRLLKS